MIRSRDPKYFSKILATSNDGHLPQRSELQIFGTPPDTAEDLAAKAAGQMRRDATGMRILLGVLVSASCFQVHAAADVAHKPDTSRNQLLDFGGRRTLQCVGEDGSCSSSGGCCAGLYCRASASKCTSGLGRGPLRGEECISGICAFGMLCMEGLCRAPGDLGTPCETSLGCNAGYYCAARNLVCEALGGVDDPCDSSSPCGDGLKCSTGSKPLCVVWPTIRLAGRPGITKGRVEVYMNDTWGTVCDKNFDEVDAGVVCKQLGFSSQGAQAYGKSYFGKGIGPIHMVGVSCTGSEASLQECGFKPTNKCLHRADAAVVCKMENIAIGTVELMGAEDMSKDGYAAIDGNTNGSWSGGSIAHSRKTGWTSPYLSLDKDVGQWKIEKIVLFNCVDACCSDRLFPFTLTLYNTHGQISGKVLEGQISEKVLEETIDKSDVKNKKNKINFFLSDQNFVANQVRITLPGEDRILNIAELEVYGYKYDPPPNPPPVATHCPSPSTSLFEASKSGNALCVGALFDAGADINMADEYDQTPLHFAAEFGDVDTVIALLDPATDRACFMHKVFYNSHPKQPKLPSGSCLAVNEFLNNNAIITAPATFPGSTCTSPPHEATVGGRDASLMATCAEVDTVKGAQWMDDVFNEFIYMPILANKVSESGINVQVIASVSEEEFSESGINVQMIVPVSEEAVSFRGPWAHYEQKNAENAARIASLENEVRL
eukprot:gene4775-34533_t